MTREVDVSLPVDGPDLTPRAARLLLEIVQQHEDREPAEAA
jgi:hypothetical protein